ncbi:hypothetical protein MYP_1285 [Sporocytophaga myxococcoides]|uniref:Glycosyl transferase family 1 domain-containing protein n=1 Tax=Sporocytophaga myxococcoides TaxID=153721 RepID=A0A098LC82_9BACT|nr:glycosyltransferase family 4 protein [Sporocytophaga myxococcoides]GAL84057.1 hypothetical protein MYP_1285 [Sporocytophaga myxococcoides]
MLTLSHPTGNANVRAVAIGLQKAGLLDEFYTSLAAFPGDYLSELAKLGGPFLEINRRIFDPSLRSYTHSRPFTEIGRLLSSKFGLSYLTRHESGPFCVDSVYRNIDRNVSKALRHSKSSKAVYAYEDGAEYSFIAAKKMGMLCLYDLPIGYWRAARNLLEAELEKWPEWSGTITGFKDSAKKLARKDEELKLADQIYVASSFTAKTLESYPGKLAQIEVIPYGFPKVGKSRDYQKSKALRVLFVGSLSQRKGIANLLTAVDSLGKSVELTIVGHKVVEDCTPLNKALAKHKWIPSLSHPEVLKLMREQDVLVFPSLFEGFGLVITEAMSQGTPVITTDRTAGPDLIEHGRNGWLIEAGSTNSLQETLENLIKHPEQCESAGREAMETAKLRPWETYGKELANNILKLVE